MVRFIIRRASDLEGAGMNIYIPIWLDLLCFRRIHKQARQSDLHSNMVRFIICKEKITQYKEEHIYIPIWLDLLYFSDAHNSSAA